ncbi:MAG: cysteine synthase family protein [Bacteroidota bacterium]
MTLYTAARTSFNKRIQQVEKRIGNTPLFKVSHVYNHPNITIYAKLEWHQLGESVKARPAFQIIKHAIEEGWLGAGQHLLDATSGNTGIAYASIGAALGIPVTLFLPENASEERKDILKRLGANLILTSQLEGTDGAQREAKALYEKHPDRYYYADQYSNEQNWRAHYETTANEIWKQTQGKISHFVAGLGTTGTFVGTSRRLRELNPQIQLTALQPNNPLHGLEGWKDLETAIVPKIYDKHIADQFLEVDTIAAYEMVKKVALQERLLISPSAAANLLGAIEVATQIEEGVIVTTFADNAEKYGEVMKRLF